MYLSSHAPDSTCMRNPSSIHVDRDLGLLHDGGYTLIEKRNLITGRAFATMFEIRLQEILEGTPHFAVLDSSGGVFLLILPKMCSVFVNKRYG